MNEKLPILGVLLFSFISAYSLQAEDNLYKSVISTNQELNKVVGAVGSTKGSDCATPVATWEGAGFTNAEIKTIDIPTPTKPRAVVYTHEFDLSVVMLRDAGWNELMVRNSLARTSEIYSQCGIRIGKVKLVTVSSPNEKRGLTFSEEASSDVEMSIPDLKKPIIFLVSWISNTNHAAFAKNRTKLLNEKQYDTVWVSSYINSKDYKALRRKEYSTVAHELAHVLGNTGHVTKGHANILREGEVGGLAGDKITKEQCELFKKYPMMKKLQI